MGARRDGHRVRSGARICAAVLPESRGDVILNPLDARCPFWTPGDEVPHEAEALTVAASLFPDRGRENQFFVDAPRKIFAHLINLKPTPEQLTYWMCHEEEIEKRVRGTELAAMIHATAPPQRSGVLGSLNMVADAFKLLPPERETERRWSAYAWSRERRGWLFLTSKPTMRERLRPLMSLWLDLLSAAADERGRERGAEDMVRAGRAGDAATVAAVDDGNHGGPEIE